MDSADIKKTLKGYYEKLYAYKFHNWNKIEKVLEGNKPLKLIQEEIDDL